MKRRVVVTGLGIVSPLGNDLASSWEGITHGRSGIGPLTNISDAYLDRFTTKIAGEVKGFDITADNELFGKFRVSGKDAKKMDPFIHYGLGARSWPCTTRAWRSPTPMPSASAPSSAGIGAARHRRADHRVPRGQEDLALLRAQDHHQHAAGPAEHHHRPEGPVVLGGVGVRDLEPFDRYRDAHDPVRRRRRDGGRRCRTWLLADRTVASAR